MKDCDFIPPNYHEAQTLRRAIKLRAACVGALLAIMVVWAIAHHNHLATAQAMLPEIAKEQEQVDIHLAKKAAMSAEQAALRDRQRLLQQLEAQASIVLILGDLSRRQPDAIVLTELSAEFPSLKRFSTEEESPAPAEPPKPPDKASSDAPKLKEEQPPSAARLTVKGIAADNPDMVRFAAALESSPLFSRIHLEVKGPAVWAGRRAQAFELTCELSEQHGGDQ